MQIKLSQEDLVLAISNYTTKMLISNSEMEITLPDLLPTSFILGGPENIRSTNSTETGTDSLEAAQHGNGKKPKKPKKRTKAQIAETNAAIEKLGIEPEVPNADDVEVPEISEETANVIAGMEGKGDEKKAPTKKRMFGQ